MAVTLFAADADGENYVANTTTFQFTVPGGVQQNDIIEFAVATTSATSTTLTPSLSTGALLPSFLGGTEAYQAQSWYYRVPATIPATITVTAAAARQGSISWRVWRGVHATYALDATPIPFSNTSAASSITIPNLMVATSGAYVVTQLFNGSGTDGVTPAGGWAIDVDPSRRHGLLLSKGPQVGAGATGAQALSWSSGSYIGRGLVFAWRAADASTPPPILANAAGQENWESPGANPLTMNVPAGTQPGDVIVLTALITNYVASSIFTTPTNAVILVPFASNSTDAISAITYLWTAPASVPLTITVPLSSTQQGALSWVRYRNVDIGNALASTVGVRNFSSGASATGIAPSVTTTDANAFIVGGLVLGSGGSDYVQTPPSGWTVGGLSYRRVGITAYRGGQATAGATGTASWAVGINWLSPQAWQVALRSFPGAAASPIVTSTAVSGAPSATGFAASARFSLATQVRLRVASDSGLTTSVSTGAWAAVDADGYCQAAITGLAGGKAKWFYGFDLMDGLGNVTSTTWQGSCYTLAPAGTPTTTIIGWGSCWEPLANPGTNIPSFARILARGPQLFAHAGDLHYDDDGTATLAAQRGNIEDVFAMPAASGMRALMSQVATMRLVSDHDGSNGNDGGVGPWTPFNRTANKQVFTYPELSDPDGLYYSFVDGNVRIIVTDHAYLSTTGSLLGATQKAWFKNQLLQPEPIKVWVQEGAWLKAPTEGGDGWVLANAERIELGTFIETDAVGQVVTIHGGQHAISADDGSGNPWGGFPVYCGSPFYNWTYEEVTVDGWSQGIWPSPPGATASQYGWLEITDAGSEITVSYNGYGTDDVSHVSHSFVVAVESDLAANPTDGVALTDTVAAPVSRPRAQGDGAILTDAASASASRPRSQGDALGLADVAVAAAALPRSSTDAAVLSDAIDRALSAVRGLSDGLGLTDAVTATLGASVTISDALGLGDVAARTASAGRSGADAAGLTDVVTRTLSAGRAQADGLGLGDQVTIELATAGEVLTQDGLTIGDQVVRVVTSQRGPADGAGLSDSVTATLTRVVTITDLLNLADGTSVTSGGSTALADGLGLTDAVLVTRSSARPLSDPLTLSDTITLQRTVGILIADVLGVLDVVTPSWDGYQPVPLPDVLTVTLVPQEMATVTILDLNGRPIVGCVAELVEKRGDTRERSLILNRSLVGLAASDLRILIASRTGVVETITPVIEDAEGGRISFRFTGTLPVGFYVLEVEVTTPTEVSTHPTDGFIQVTIEPDLGP